ncbi:permease [Pradoshia sp. D12]|uniref:Wadjet anti-phage system protein JetD domain-containing protein n=1 Tax=Bacillaceae TaxID=186817 RepID=UPI00112B5115|nr:MULTISPECIES: Wadjet anti-phage system protein JetD domain-containing protein [Bacillaceae]QFK71464.1 permease [Pradoshia sp. D12]TPF73259.1 permease [Bacillus sp. D12]
MAVINKVEVRVRQFIEDIQHPQQKKKLNVNVLESQLRIHIEDYFDMDGYTLFHDVIERLVEENILIPILNKQTNGRHPALPLFYWVNIKKEITKWDRLEMLKLNDRFDFSYYENHPEWQTEDEWFRVKNLYSFLKSSQDRQIVSLEERSLELFGHEKFLTDSDLFPEGKGFLQRIGVSMEELKSMKFGEPFVFWLKPGVQIADIKRVLIVENLSFFHTCVQLLEEEILDYEPELIIYGEGKKIERSFSFFFKLFPKDSSYLFYYVGDLDAEGYSICMRLIDKYQECTIQPALKIYRKMLDCMDQANSETGQVRNEIHRERFFSWFTEEEQNSLNELWATKNRIPQEVLTIETWRRWM